MRYCCFLIIWRTHSKSAVFSFDKGRTHSRNKATGPEYILLDFLSQMRQNCLDNKNINSRINKFLTFVIFKPMNAHSNKKGMSYMQALSSAVSSKEAFDTQWYQSLLRKRGEGYCLLINSWSYWRNTSRLFSTNAYKGCIETVWYRCFDRKSRSSPSGLFPNFRIHFRIVLVV